LAGVLAYPNQTIRIFGLTDSDNFWVFGSSESENIRVFGLTDSDIFWVFGSSESENIRVFGFTDSENILELEYTTKACDPKSLQE
jgi:hypothetical protein